MSETDTEKLPGFGKEPTVFKTLKKGEIEDTEEEAPSPHVREARVNKDRYSCKFMDKKDITKPCPFKTAFKKALTTHELSHARQALGNVFESDLLHVEIPVGVEKTWSDEHNMYIYHEMIKLPEGFSVIYRSPKSITRDHKYKDRSSSIYIDFYSLTLLKDAVTDEPNKVKNPQELHCGVCEDKGIKKILASEAAMKRHFSQLHKEKVHK